MSAQLRLKPIANATIPTKGIRSFGFRRSATHVHAGIDIPAREGTPVYAPASGRVTAIVGHGGPDATAQTPGPPFRGYGPLVVVIRDDEDRYHVLAHLGAVVDGLRVGARVDAGAPVAFVGRTSHPHLHWEVRLKPLPPRGKEPFAVSVNPATWLAEGTGAPLAEVTPEGAIGVTFTTEPEAVARFGGIVVGHG